MKFFKSNNTSPDDMPSSIHKRGKLNVKNLEENVWVPESQKPKKPVSTQATITSQLESPPPPSSPSLAKPIPSSPSSANLFDTLTRQAQIRKAIAAAKTSTSPTRTFEEQSTPVISVF